MADTSLICDFCCQPTDRDNAVQRTHYVDPFTMVCVIHNDAGQVIGVQEVLMRPAWLACPECHWAILNEDSDALLERSAAGYPNPETVESIALIQLPFWMGRRTGCLHGRVNA